ncbi:nucleotidyltransferase family protein [Archangium violaceum]|uniref:nucleotidyltransferase family protein n=1 Tax=Archangium violaceum TaxID=83451 RepID=UPI002B2AE785|nr:nucleotidyltransferase family protein [Archangium violaceum]
MSSAGALPFSAIVLAAGASSRLGMPKQLVRLEGEPLVCRAARVANESGARSVIVVTGASHEAVAEALGGARVRLAHNTGWAEGPGTSIRAGIEALLADASRPREEQAVLMLCDQPFVTPEHLRALVEQVTRGHPAAASDYGGEGGFGVPAAFAAELLPELLALSGHQGAKPVLMRHRARLALVPFAEGLFDVDTPADLERLGLSRP